MIDWEKKRLRVMEAFIRLAKGSEFGPTKTKRSKRLVALPEFLDALLEEKAPQAKRKEKSPE